MKKKLIALGLSVLFILIGAWFIRPLIFAQKQGVDVDQIAKAIVRIHLTGEDIVPLDTKEMYLEKIGLEGEEKEVFTSKQCSALYLIWKKVK